MNYTTHSLKRNNAKIYYVCMLFLFIFTSCETSSLSELSTVEEEEEILEDEEIPNIVTYESRAQEILDNACAECHNANEQTAGVRLDAFEFAFIEAENGRMIARMTDTTNPMPPSGNLPNNIIEDIVNWIDNGILEN